MRKALASGILLVCLGTGSAAAENLYFSGGLSLTNIKTTLSDDLQSFGFTVFNEASDTALGWQLTGGYMFNQNFGVELRLSWTGNAKDTIRFTDGVVIGELDSKIKLYGAQMYAVGELPVTDRFGLFGKLGWVRQEAKATFSAPGVSETAKDDEGGLAIAGGLRWRVGGNWAVTAEVEYFNIDVNGAIKEPVRGSLNLEYRL